MSKSYDEKREAFDRLCDPRLERAVKAIELLANLARKSDYAWTDQKLQQMLDSLDDAVDVVAKAFGASAGSAPAPAEERSVDGLAHKACGGGVVSAPVQIDQRAEVRWAYDALKRGDTALAKERLSRVIKVWIEEEKSR
jgi:hypothetical protein